MAETTATVTVRLQTQKIIERFEKECPYLDLKKRGVKITQTYKSKQTQMFFDVFVLGYLACTKDITNKDLSCIEALVDKNTYKEK